MACQVVGKDERRGCDARVVGMAIQKSMPEAVIAVLVTAFVTASILQSIYANISTHPVHTSYSPAAETTPAAYSSS